MLSVFGCERVNVCVRIHEHWCFKTYLSDGQHIEIIWWVESFTCWKSEFICFTLVFHNICSNSYFIIRITLDAWFIIPLFICVENNLLIFIINFTLNFDVSIGFLNPSLYLYAEAIKAAENNQDIPSSSSTSSPNLSEYDVPTESFYRDVANGDNKCLKDPYEFCCLQGFSAVEGWDPVSGIIYSLIPFNSYILCYFSQIDCFRFYFVLFFISFCVVFISTFVCSLIIKFIWKEEYLTELFTILIHAVTSLFVLSYKTKLTSYIS